MTHSLMPQTHNTGAVSGQKPITRAHNERSRDGLLVWSSLAGTSHTTYTMVIRPDVNRWHHQMKAISLSWLPCAHRGSHCCLHREFNSQVISNTQQVETRILNSLPLFFDGYNKDRDHTTHRQTDTADILHIYAVLTHAHPNYVCLPANMHQPG